MNLPAKRYSEAQLERAKSTQRIIGWIQGSGAVLAGAVLWKFLGWIPVALVVLAVGWIMVKLLSGDEQEERVEDTVGARD